MVMSYLDADGSGEIDLEEFTITLREYGGLVRPHTHR